LYSLLHAAFSLILTMQFDGLWTGMVALTLGVHCLGARAQAPADVRVALVIGNAAYPSAPLVTASNDAKAVADTLRGLGFKVFEARDASKLQMEAALAQARNAMQDANAVGLLFYSGHALQQGWHNYMIPVDATLLAPQDVPANAMDVQTVVEAFRRSGNRMNVFVLDACRENPFGVSASGRGLAPMDAPPGTLLAYSAVPGEVGDDGDVGNGHGLYVHYLLRELVQPGAKVEDVFKRVRFQVRKQSQGRQVPWESTSLESDFVFDAAAVSVAHIDEDHRVDTAGAPQPVWTSGRIGAKPLASDFVAGNARFQGSFRIDPGSANLSGTGTVTWSLGDRFEGTLVNGRREGWGRFTWPNGQRFEGDWVADRPDGKGNMWFANGDEYEGPIDDGRPVGLGRMRYSSGDRYVGPFKDGRPHGRGAYTWSSGQSLVGDWVDGEVQGAGTLRFASGDVYDGQIVDGQADGQGRILFAAGGSYQGSFRRGNREGDGTYSWSSGDRYVGKWKGGTKNGPGVMTWKNGDRWEGTFQADSQLEGTMTRGTQ
jgi:hypothetical protein